MLLNSDRSKSWMLPNREYRRYLVKRYSITAINNYSRDRENGGLRSLA